MNGGELGRCARKLSNAINSSPHWRLVSIMMVAAGDGTADLLEINKVRTRKIRLKSREQKAHAQTRKGPGET